MEAIFLIYSSLSILFFFFFTFKFFSKYSLQNLPPSPPSLPILGHLRLLKQPLHRTLQSLSQNYGPVLSLRFGSRLVVVISSFSAAEECFTKNDIVFAARPKTLAGNSIDSALVLAGTDTSAVTSEWAMSNLLNNPKQLQKARAEIDTKAGQNRLINESDLPNLPYLQAIISETLRLYPAAPLLVLHQSFDKSTVRGYDVPKDTMVIINVWAIHRDPETWADPTSFKPGRFETSNYSNKMLAFGLGRRACPGAGLANRVVGMILGGLIQCFEWERVEGDFVDMNEGNGLTMPKMKPLHVMRPRCFVGASFIEETSL